MEKNQPPALRNSWEDSSLGPAAPCPHLVPSGPPPRPLRHASVSLSSFQKVWSYPRQTPLSVMKDQVCVGGGGEHPKEACTRTKGQKAKNLRLSHTSHHESGDEAHYLPCRHEDLSGHPELREEPSIVEISWQSPHWKEIGGSLGLTSLSA